MKQCILFTALALSACTASAPDSGFASDNALHKVWQVRQIDQAVPPAKLSLEFRKDRSFSIDGGCNMQFGGYTLNDGTLKFGDISSTLRACETHLMEADNLAAAAVGKARRYRIQNQRLELLDENGKVLLQAE